MSYKGTNAVNPGPGTTAEGQINFSGTEVPTQAPELVFKQKFSKPDKESGLDGDPDAAGELLSDAGISNPNPSHGYDLDMGLQPNKFPRQGGSDTLKGDEVIFS